MRVYRLLLPLLALFLLLSVGGPMRMIERAYALCCPTWVCPPWKSAAVVDITILGNPGKARIATNQLEKNGLFLEIEVSDDVKQMFKEVNTNHDYGLVVIGGTPTNPIITDFVSFYREHHNPEKEIEKRIPTEKALNQYNKMLEDVVLQQKGSQGKP